MEKRIEEKISTHLHEISLEEIEIMSKLEQNGVLSNVLRGLEDESYSLLLSEEGLEGTIQYALSYVGNNKNRIKGYLLEGLNAFDKERDEMTFGFSTFLAQKFSSVDSIDAYNTFQSFLRSALEKLGYFTYTQDLLDKIEGENPVMVLKSQKGAIFVPFINKIETYRDIFRKRDKGQKNNSIDYIYLFFNDRNKLTKIGTSKSPAAREKTLQGQEPIIEVIAKWKAPKKIERELHKIFKAKRIRGEWFDLNTNDYLYISDFMAVYELDI